MPEHKAGSDVPDPQPGDLVYIPEWYCTDSVRGEGWGSRGHECEHCGRYMFDGTESVTEDAWSEHYVRDHGFVIRPSEAQLAAVFRILNGDDDVKLGEIRRDLRNPPEKVQPPDLIPVPAGCENCGAPLAWRTGVGRYVISHATGDDVCSRAVARLSDADREAAALAYRQADDAFRAALSTPPGSTGGEGL